jgi:hypothetical protein
VMFATVVLPGSRRRIQQENKKVGIRIRPFETKRIRFDSSNKNK